MKAVKLLFLVILLPLSHLYSQSNREFEGGLILGASSYSGDLTPSLTPRMKDIAPSFGLSARTALSQKFKLRASLTSFKFQSSDKNYPEREGRGFSFKTNLYELAMVTEWEPFGKNRYFGDARGNRVFQPLISPYFYSGVTLGFASTNPNFSGYKGTSTTVLNGIVKDKQYGSSSYVFSIPIGFGVKYDVTERIVVGLDASMRLSFSDYIDGICFSASPLNKDSYSSLQLMVFYRFRNN
jgi:hypothetical protein